VAIAIPWRFVLPFALGIGSLIAWVPAAGLWFAGFEYEEFLGHPELVFLSAAACALCVRLMPQELRPTGRIVVLGTGLASLLALSSTTNLTLLPIDGEYARVMYQALSVAVAIAVIVRDWMPKYLFFLILAGAALAWLWGLRILRRRVMAAAA
jgi:hypothetical protein